MVGTKTAFNTSNFYLANRLSLLLLVFIMSDIAFRGSRIELGAEQCKYKIYCGSSMFMRLPEGILVRNKKAKEKLRQDIGEVGLIM